MITLLITLFALGTLVIGYNVANSSTLAIVLVMMMLVVVTNLMVNYKLAK